MSIIEFILKYPKTSIIIFAFIVALIVTVINKFFTNQKRIKEIKLKQKEIQNKIKEHNKRGEKEKILELQKEMMNDSVELFKHSLKPTLITMIPLLVFFFWIKNIYSETIIANTWIWYYIVSALIFSIILRKIFDVA